MAASEKPGKGNRIFISTVSGEFEKVSAAFPGLRSKLRHHLTAANCEVRVQEDFRQTHGGTLEKLDEYIRDCDAVIHLVGKMPGHLADADSPQDVIDYLAHIAAEPGGRTFLDKQPELLADFGDGSGISLTQFEAYMALHHRVPLFVYATPEAASGQQAHLNRLLKGRPRKHASPFSDAADLLGQLIGDLRDIIPALSPTEQRIAPTRLISRHTAADFLGRDKELALLDAAWNQEQGTTNLLSIIAWGGVGKTALLAYWVQSRFIEKGWLNAQGQPDPIAYFDWTFYDQGTRSDDATHAGAASVGTFFQSALKHFGDPDPESPHDKAARLAQHIQAQRSLLVLDGLEPLQYPLNHPQAGQLTDPDLRELLGLLAQRNPGLVIISSRQALTDFTCGAATPTRQHDLEELPVEFAIALLRKMQIIGTDEELKAAAEDYFCHALSLIVLGRFLFMKGGDIRLRSQIPLERANENRNQRITRNAWHVLEAYEQWLASPAGNAADVQALRLTGLFDRPASPDCLAALRKAPAIPGLTDQLVPLSDDAWNAVLHRLHEAHLFQLRFPPVDPGSFAPRPEAREVTVDVHPLIREYFAKQLREKQSEGFKAAHSRQFDHLCARTEHRPATLEGLQPLYQAVVHGCLAGRQQEACDKVYVDRILRGTGPGGDYSTKQLGAIGADLGAVAAFFEEPWSRLSVNLSAANQAWLLNEAAYSLRSLGRLTEAVEPIQVALKMGVTAENWKSAAIRAGNLSELEVTLGRVAEAVAGARRSIEFAGRNGKWGMRTINHSVAADALHQSGEWEEARHYFDQAELMQREDQPKFDLLYGLAGFRYCDLILAPAERAAWRVVGTLDCGTLLPLAEGSPAAVNVPKGLPSLDAPAPAKHEDSEPRQGTHVPAGLAGTGGSRLPQSRTAVTALAEADRRAKQTLEWSQQYRGALLDIALDHLTLARVALYRALLEPLRPSSFDLRHAIAALDGIRKAGTMDHLPRALLTAALHAHLRGDVAAASRALAEAQQIAERGPMPLYLADVHLHRARLFHDKTELAKARALIEKHGYWRRKEELEDAEAAAVLW
jgi:tetratricopeptide (TPR) repeat protein